MRGVQMNTRVAGLALLLVAVCAAHAGEVKGKVVNVRGGEALRQVQVGIAERHLSTTTLDDGSFRFTGVPAGQYTLRISAIGFRYVAVPFSLATDADIREFSVTLAPDNYRRAETVEVRGSLFHGENPAEVGQIALTSTEIKEASTVLADDPFRSIQALPGVSPVENNDFFAQFSVLGAPFEQVGVYVDGVLVPQPFHSIPGVQDGASLSLFSSETLDEVKLMPIAYPVRYGDLPGAALALSTREGSRSRPLFTVSAGMADTNVIGEGGLGRSKGSWLASARKSYLGYLARRSGGDPFTDISFEDADLKLTYDLTARQNVDFYALAGRTNLDQTNAIFDNNQFKTGQNNFTLARAGWRFAMSPNLVLEATGAYIEQQFRLRNTSGQNLNGDYYGEWVGTTRALWHWSQGHILEAGYTGRRLSDTGYSVFYNAGGPEVFGRSSGVFLRQDGYAQEVSSFFSNRLHVMAGLRWDRLEDAAMQPLSSQASMSLQVASRTQLEFGFARHSQLPDAQTLGQECAFSQVGRFPSFLVDRFNHFEAAVEQEMGENARVRVEAFAREGEQLLGLRGLAPAAGSCGDNIPDVSAPLSREYSRGLQLVLQRRSANRLSGWIGYTLDFARQKELAAPAISPALVFNTGYFPTLQDQRHTLNTFASYRLSPMVNLSGKFLFGSGLPFPSITFRQVGAQFIPTGFNTGRLGLYQRLDVRADKAWTFARWKMTLYAEVLNLTDHDNRRLLTTSFNPTTGTSVAITERGLPVTPTVGLVFEF